MEHQKRFELLSNEIEKMITSIASQATDGGAKGMNGKAELARAILAAQGVMTEMKASSRRTFVAIEGLRKKVSASKEEMDADHLQLQNLLYEKDHILRETKLCRDFTTVEVDRMEEDEGESFLEGIDRKQTEEEHHTNLAILQQQLKLRQNAKVKLDEARIKARCTRQAVEEKTRFLEKLPGYLKDVEKATAPLQRYMPKLRSPMRRGQYHKATELPGPLYTLFCQLEAHCDAMATAEPGDIPSENEILEDRVTGATTASASTSGSAGSGNPPLASVSLVPAHHHESPSASAAAAAASAGDGDGDDVG
ncbi:unnamed protein product, partial [Discosporangium mesarthrocarpum]